MDERKLTELFNGAIPDAPPPSFDYDDVAAESGRQRMRRRTALLGGSALGIALLAGATVLGVALWKGTNATEGATAANAPLAAGESGNAEGLPSETPNEDARQSAPGAVSEQDRSFSVEVPKQGGPPTGNAGPKGPGSTSSGCGQADVELAAALAGELPSAAQSPRLPADITCPPSSRGVALMVDGGIVSLVVSPADVVLTDPLAGQPSGTTVRAGSTPDGRRILLVSEPPPNSTSPPRDTELQGILDRLRRAV